MSDWYDKTSVPGTGAAGASAPIRTEYALIETAMAKLPTLIGNNYEIVRVNSSGTALESVGASTVLGYISTIDDANNNTVTNVMVLTHTTSGTPGVGIGTGISFVTETSASNNETGACIQAVTTGVGAGAENFDLVFKLMTAGAAASELARLKSTGAYTLPTGGVYQVNGTTVLSGNALGSGVLASSLTSLGTIASLVATTADINDGTVDAIIGGTTPKAGTFTTLTATAGTIDGNIIGGSTPAAGTFTTLIATDGTINGNVIGGSTPAAGSFTTLTASSTLGVTGVITAINGGTWDANGIDIPTGGTYAINGVDVLTSTTAPALVTASALDSIGTITTGVWQGTAVAAAYMATATASAQGAVELADNTEAAAGAATNRALTPANASSLNVGMVDGLDFDVLTQTAYNAIAHDVTTENTVYFIVGA